MIGLVRAMAKPWAVMMKPDAVPLTPRSVRMSSSTGTIVAPPITPSVEPRRSRASTTLLPTPPGSVRASVTA
jgi:hypothetical protein